MIVVFLFIGLILLALGVLAVLMKKTDPSLKNQNSQAQNQTNDEEESPKASNFITKNFGSLLNTAASYLGILGIKKDTDPKTAQEFIPFDKIEDSMICFTDVNGMKYYRMIVECSSINYGLKTPQEQEILDEQFKSSIDSWDFPWGIYIQTRIMDNRGILHQTEQEITNVVSRYPMLEEYGNEYYKFIKDEVAVTSSNVLVKKKYIIIACNDASTMTELDDIDQQDWAYDKLRRRADIIKNSLSRMGIVCNLCNNAELSSIIFQAFNKKSGGVIDGVVEGDFLAGAVNGYDPQQKFDPNELSEMIREFVNQIDTVIINSANSSIDDRVKAEKVKEQATHLMDVFKDDGGYF